MWQTGRPLAALNVFSQVTSFIQHPWSVQRVLNHLTGAEWAFVQVRFLRLQVLESEANYGHPIQSMAVGVGLTFPAPPTSSSSARNFVECFMDAAVRPVTRAGW